MVHPENILNALPGTGAPLPQTILDALETGTLPQSVLDSLAASGQPIPLHLRDAFPDQNDHHPDIIIDALPVTGGSGMQFEIPDAANPSGMGIDWSAIPASPTILTTSDITDTFSPGVHRFTDNGSDISSNWIVLQTLDAAHSQTASQFGGGDPAICCGLSAAITPPTIPPAIVQLNDSGGVPAGTVCKVYLARSDGNAALWTSPSMAGVSWTTYYIPPSAWGPFTNAGFPANSLTIVFHFPSNPGGAFASISGIVLNPATPEGVTNDPPDLAGNSYLRRTGNLGFSTTQNINLTQTALATLNTTGWQVRVVTRTAFNAGRMFFHIRNNLGPTNIIRTFAAPNEATPADFKITAAFAEYVINLTPAEAAQMSFLSRPWIYQIDFSGFDEAQTWDWASFKTLLPQP